MNHWGSSETAYPQGCPSCSRRHVRVVIHLKILSAAGRATLRVRNFKAPPMEWSGPSPSSSPKHGLSSGGKSLTDYQGLFHFRSWRALQPFGICGAKRIWDTYDYGISPASVQLWQFPIPKIGPFYRHPRSFVRKSFREVKTQALFFIAWICNDLP